MAAPSVNFSYGNGLQSGPQQPYCQPPVPLFPYNIPLPQPLFNSNPWVAQCMPPVQCHYQQQHLMGTNYIQQPTRGRGKNWHRQNHPNKVKRQDRNSTNAGTKDFHCETCESSFRTEFDLNGHMSQHRQCIHPGCNFTAVTRVLKEHEMVHRIPKELLFTSEEEITKWREDRRKKYPTVARVKEKLAKEEAKMQRGETAKDDVYRYRKRGGADYGYPGAKRGRGGRGRFHGRPHRQDRRSSERLSHPSESLDDSNDGTLDQLTSSLAKDTGITGCSSSQKPKAPILRNTSRHKATLLEKLLAPEIRQERNTILQCIRHIVKKNFFGIEGSGSDAETSNEASSEANDCDVSPVTCADDDGQSDTKCEDPTPSSSDAIVDHVCMN